MADKSLHCYKTYTGSSSERGLFQLTAVRKNSENLQWRLGIAEVG